MLVRKLKAGDDRAFAQLVDRYGGRIHHLARRAARSTEDAEDLTQDILCEVYRSIGRFRGGCALSTWIYRVAYNHCCKHVSRRREPGLPLDEAELLPGVADCEPYQQAVLSELAGRIEAALQQLTSAQAEVVVLCELHGLTYSECAQVLGIPIGTVKSRLSNAFARLRPLLAPYVMGKQTPGTALPIREVAL